MLLPQFIENIFFRLYQQNKSSEKKFRQASNRCKRVLEAAKLPYVNKTNSPSLPRNLVFRTFGELLKAFSTKLNLVYHLYSMAWRCCLLYLIKNFSKKSNLDDSSISLPVFPSRTSLERHDISLSPKMVKKVITSLDSSKSSGPDCIQ